MLVTFGTHVYLNSFIRAFTEGERKTAEKAFIVIYDVNDFKVRATVTFTYG